MLNTIKDTAPSPAERPPIGFARAFVLLIFIGVVVPWLAALVLLVFRFGTGDYDLGVSPYLTVAVFPVLVAAKGMSNQPLAQWLAGVVLTTIQWVVLSALFAGFVRRLDRRTAVGAALAWVAMIWLFGLCVGFVLSLSGPEGRIRM